MVTPCMGPSRGTSPPVCGVLLPLPTTSQGGATLSKFNPPPTTTGGCRLPHSFTPGLPASPPPLPGASAPPPSSTSPPHQCLRRRAPSGRTLPPQATPPTIPLFGRRLPVAACGLCLGRWPAPRVLRPRRSLGSLPAARASAQLLLAPLRLWGATSRRQGHRPLPSRLEGTALAMRLPRYLLFGQRRRLALPPVETLSLAPPCQHRRPQLSQRHNNSRSLRTLQSTVPSTPRFNPPHPLPPGSRNPILVPTT